MDWREEIRQAIASAKVAVLLVSADFLASDFIASDELPRLLAKAESEGTVVSPVIISPYRFEETKGLSRFQAVNPPSRPLAGICKLTWEEVLTRRRAALGCRQGRHTVAKHAARRPNQGRRRFGRGV